MPSGSADKCRKTSFLFDQVLVKLVKCMHII
jgi:hypothetical protein